MRAIFLTLLLGTTALAVELQPYPDFEITVAQWQVYFDTVAAEFGDSREELDTAKLILFFDADTATTFAFTRDDHPAHPAWVSRRLAEVDGEISIQQVGYFAGEEPPFAALFDDFAALADEIRATYELQDATE